MKNKNKGITLIALVITIIMLLILAGVTIGALNNSNIFEKAKIAKEKYENEQNKEQKELEKYMELMNSTGKYEELPENTTETEAGTIVKIPSNWYTTTANYTSIEDGTIVKKAIKVASVTAVSTGNGQTVPVPDGFYYVGGTLDSGVVISDDLRDQNKYAGVPDVPAGAVYNSDGTVKKYTDEEYEKLSNDQKKNILLGNQFVWIPCSLSEYAKYDFEKTNASGWDTSTNTAEETQIQKYGGFYIGRYEAGASEIKFANNYTLEKPTGTSSWQNANFTSNKVTSGKIATKAGQIPYFHADYTTAVEMCKAMYNTNSVNSGLVTGTMWDVTLKFITEDSKNYSDLMTSPWGNYRSDTSEVEGSGIIYTPGRGRYLSVDINDGVASGAFTVSDASYHTGIRTSGWADGAKKNNIYDLAGNLWEWTQEVSYYSTDTNLFTLRGGPFNLSYESNGFPVCYRRYFGRGATSTNVGFRPVLYMK